jgi:hypothetical protein
MAIILPEPPHYPRKEYGGYVVVHEKAKHRAYLEIAERVAKSRRKLAVVILYLADGAAEAREIEKAQGVVKRSRRKILVEKKHGTENPCVKNKLDYDLSKQAGQKKLGKIAESASEQAGNERANERNCHQ